MAEVQNSVEARTARYAEALAQMVRAETVSGAPGAGNERFLRFRALLRALFPGLYGACEETGFDDGFLMRWPGRDPEKPPLLFMNHHDVVEAEGAWRFPPFSGQIAEGRLWGRGTLDDKGGLWAMLQAAEELIAEGYVPAQDIWFSSSSTEETTGRGADAISRWLEERGVRFRMCLDEGGFIVREPIPGAKADFALIGVGEKGCADLKFTARSRGGHASMPPGDTPLVRLGKFMAEADRHAIFPARLSSTVCALLRGLAPYMGAKGKLMAQPERFRGLLTAILLRISPRTAALLRTTVAFTMAQGAGAVNVLPTEAWVICNMRYSHHQGQQGSIDAIRKLAEKYDLETEVLDPGTPSRVADPDGEAFAAVRRAVEAVFPGAVPLPYVMTGASDARFFDRVCDQCVRFVPLRADEAQLSSVHGLNENVALDALAPAVDFYRRMMRGD